MATQVVSLDQAKALLATAELRKKEPTFQVYFDAKTNQSHTVSVAGPGKVRITTVGGCVC